METQATSTLPRAARQALIKLVDDIAVARKKPRISTVSMAAVDITVYSTATEI